MKKKTRRKRSKTISRNHATWRQQFLPHTLWRTPKTLCDSKFKLLPCSVVDIRNSASVPRRPNIFPEIDQVIAICVVEPTQHHTANVCYSLKNGSNQSITATDEWGKSVLYILLTLLFTDLKGITWYQKLSSSVIYLPLKTWTCHGHVLEWLWSWYEAEIFWKAEIDLFKMTACRLLALSASRAGDVLHGLVQSR